MWRFFSPRTNFAARPRYRERGGGGGVVAQSAFSRPIPEPGARSGLWLLAIQKRGERSSANFGSLSEGINLTEFLRSRQLFGQF